MGTKHTACSTEHSLLFGFTCLERSGSSFFIDNNLTLLLPTFGAPCMSIFGFLRRTSSYLHDMTLIVTRVTLTSTSPVTTPQDISNQLGPSS